MQYRRTTAPPARRRYSSDTDLDHRMWWLFGPERETSNKILYFASGIPGIGHALRLWDNYDKMSDYLSRNNLTWANVRYPASTPYAVGGNLTGMYYTVSSNIKRMYR